MKRPYLVKPSAIHGNGLFAAKAFRTGEYLPDPNDYCLHNFGGFNHSCQNNVELNEDMIIALRDIEIGEELTVDYDHCQEKSKKRCNCPVCKEKPESERYLLLK